MICGGSEVKKGRYLVCGGVTLENIGLGEFFKEWGDTGEFVWAAVGLVLVGVLVLLFCWGEKQGILEHFGWFQQTVGLRFLLGWPVLVFGLDLRILLGLRQSVVAAQWLGDGLARHQKVEVVGLACLRLASVALIRHDVTDCPEGEVEVVAAQADPVALPQRRDVLALFFGFAGGGILIGSSGLAHLNLNITLTNILS